MNIASAPAPLSGLTFGLVGPGRVGSSVARWLLQRGAQLAVVSRRREAPLPRWTRGTGATAVPLRQLGAVAALAGRELDLLLVAVPDASLEAAVEALAGGRAAAVVLHTAGGVDSEVLAPLRAAGVSVGGLHPLRAFPRALPSLAVARRTFFALQGDAPAVALGERIAAALDARAAVVPPAARLLYHLAASWAAGGTVTLLGAAVDVHRAARVPAAAAAGLHELALGALQEVEPTEAAAALTGPVARGDLLVLRQLEELQRVDATLHPLAVLLALETLRQLARRSPPTEAQAALARALLERALAPGFLEPLRAAAQVLSSEAH